jgi:hypothetical protein
MHSVHSEINSQQQSLTDPSSSKPAITFALPMYTVGIGVFFIYTCFKVYQKNFYITDEIIIYLVLDKTK